MNKQNYTRLLPLEGAYNVRDLGGYKTKDNKYTKWRTIIRSGDLKDLTEEDLKHLCEIPLRTDIDFRSKYEKETAPDKHPDSLNEYTWLSIDAGDMSDIRIKDTEQVPRIMEGAYRTIVSQFQKEFKQFFRILEDETKAPLLFHCSAGKDRTGIASALFLSALGVDKETILHDYMLSAEYLKGKYDFVIQMQPSLAPLITVYPEYLQAAFQEIDDKFGGMDNYLRHHLEVDIEKLKELYTE